MFDKARLTSALTLGCMAGMRTFSAPALAARNLSRPRAKSDTAAYPVPRLPSRTAGALRLAAMGEMAADKFPKTPDRLAPAPLLGRFLSGAASAAAFDRSHSGPKLSAFWLGLTGGIAAALSALVCFHLRRQLARRTSLADPWYGLAEDGLVLGLGYFLRGVVKAAASGRGYAFKAAPGGRPGSPESMAVRRRPERV